MPGLGNFRKLALLCKFRLYNGPHIIQFFPQALLNKFPFPAYQTEMNQEGP